MALDFTRSDLHPVESREIYGKVVTPFCEAASSPRRSLDLSIAGRRTISFKYASAFYVVVCGETKIYTSLWLPQNRCGLFGS